MIVGPDGKVAPSSVTVNPKTGDSIENEDEFSGEEVLTMLDTAYQLGYYRGHRSAKDDTVDRILIEWIKTR